MVTFNVGGHEYALKFTMRVLCELGDAIGEEIDLETLSDKLFVWLKNPRKLMKMAVLMARAGEAAEGRKFAHDYDWLVDNSPGRPGRHDDGDRATGRRRRSGRCSGRD